MGFVRYVHDLLGMGWVLMVRWLVGWVGFGVVWCVSV